MLDGVGYGLALEVIRITALYMDGVYKEKPP